LLQFTGEDSQLDIGRFMRNIKKIVKLKKGNVNLQANWLTSMFLQSDSNVKNSNIPAHFYHLFFRSPQITTTTTLTRK